MQLCVNSTGPLEVNTYILKDEVSKEAVIIDLGCPFDDVKKFLEGYNLKFILNTHGHFDHILGEIDFQKKYPDIPIYMHKDDIPHLKNIKEYMQYFNYTGNTDTTLCINNFIDENSELYIGGNKIKIFYTPGHSKGSLSFYIDSMVFSGDALFYCSIGRTDFFDGDYDTLINSIKNNLLTLPDDTKIYPGHGPATTIKIEKNSNTYLK